MILLQPGEFRVADYRKAITTAAKIGAVLNAIRRQAYAQPRDKFPYASIAGCIAPQHLDDVLVSLVGPLQFDHRPPLCDRPYDTEAGDFVPPQNDPDYIEVLAKPQHDERTFGRTPGAMFTVTTANSDIGNRRKTSDIRAAEAKHKAALARKDGNHNLAAGILATAHLKKKHTRPKQKIKSRATPWPKRKFGV